MHQNHGMMIRRWMKGAVTRPTKSGRIRLAIGETEGISLKGRGCEILAGMKGWRPSACPWLDAGSGFFKRAILAGRRIDRPVFFRGSSVPGLMTRGSVDAGFPFSRNEAPRPPQSDGNAPKRPRS